MLGLVSNFSLVFILVTLLFLKLIGIDVSIIIFKVVSVIALIPVIIASFKSLKNKTVSVDFLAAVALIFAYIAGEWYSAAFINLMLASARIFEIWTERRSENLVKSLLKFRPEKVKIKNGDQIEIKDIKDIKVNDIMIIAAGERIAVDAIVISGQASVDESTLTGESEPVVKKTGNHIFSSTLNTSGSILAKAEKVAEESTLAKIISLVEKSSLKKSKTVRMVDAFSQWYIVATLAGAIVLYIISKDVNFVLAILLVVCADDIAVSIPLAFTVAVSKGAQNGILIKSSDVLERISKINVFITDKTGTLTFAKPRVTQVITFGNFKRQKFLKLLSAAESSSTHPLSRPILEFTEKEGIVTPPVSEFSETAGEGMEVMFDNEKIIAGKLDFIERKGIKIAKDEQVQADKLSRSGYSLVTLGVDGKLVGFVVFEDEPKSYIKNVIKRTKELGANLWIMLTGDNASVAQKIADFCGIDIFEANLKPDEKVRFVEKYKEKNKNKVVAMVGDGVNDAAALAIADVSFAMGAVGSDVAINAADVALMTDNLERIPEAMILGQKTRAIVYQNFAIWGITNIIGLSLVAVGVFEPTGAATYNFLTDFIPIFNALRMSRA
ncbi:MAG: cation-translocating P-type ATPase [Candidatus Woesebacteria bacterium]|nr:MAG: cation-translocating P-type ATPase [Candidatus Woesebacteria bacterium]